jgi:hypothetical protein
MSRARSAVLTSLALGAAVLLLATSAAADLGSLRPLNLRVAGGEDAWHADNDFRLDWDRPRADGQEIPIGAANLRLRDASGSVTLLETRVPGDTSQIEYIHVPWGPGRYIADVWLEGAGGEAGPTASATLLFDDVRPGPARPLPAPGWVAGDAATVLRVEQPPLPLPISGIRGYAISVGRESGIPPCAGPARCSPAETDLDAGIDGDRVSLGLLPEGVSTVSAVAVSGSGMRSAQTLETKVWVDATDPEVALDAPRNWVAGPVRVVATATDPLSGMAASGATGPYTAIAIDGRVPRTEPGASAAATIVGEGAHRVAFYGRDGAGNIGEETPRVATVRIDESAPRVAFARSQDPREPERIEAAVDDSLSGPDRQRGSIAFRPAGSHQRFEPLATAASAGKLVAHWDSDASPAGSYEFRATAYDTVGNSATTDRRANGARMVLANPLKAPTQLEAGFGGRRLAWQRCSRRTGPRRCRHEEIESFAARPDRRAMPYGGRVSFGGRLTSSSGSPLGGLAVEVIETFAAGADSPRRTTTVRTAADGSFSARLAPGPSRRIEAAFAGNPVLTQARSGEVGLDVLAGVRLRSSTASARIGGAPVLFSGRIGDRGARLPPSGRSVELQFHLPGGGWSEFRTVQTDVHGRFRYAYSFSDDDSRGIRFQFRAFIPEQDDWPYEPAFSRPVFVTGH